MEEKFQDKCAVVGIWGAEEAANYCYLALYAMQHRGQEGAGIVSTDANGMFIHRDMGLVADVFDADVLAKLQGRNAIGHTRYATCGSKDWQNLQPLVASFKENSFAIAHNGNLVNADELRNDLEKLGSIFSTTSDTEVILHRTARAGNGKSSAIVDRMIEALDGVQGAYSLVVLTLNSMIAIRDAGGVRPLSLGKIGDGYIVASETCAFDLVGAQFIRDIKPGEILEITSDGKLTSKMLKEEVKPAFCVFEYIYFSRPDSIIDGRNVYTARKNLGVELAREYPTKADLVIPVPDSGVPSAIGYAQESGIPLEFGLIRNHYVGRTFIEPQQSIRDFGVKIKLNANKAILKDKKVVVVDDSIVRGTTSRKIVKMIRAAGAKEVHFRISSPPTIGPCHYGVDTPSREELIAATKGVEEIREYLGADSLGYLSIEGVYRAVRGEQKDFCDACFTDNYRRGEPAVHIGWKSKNNSNAPRKMKGK